MMITITCCMLKFPISNIIPSLCTQKGVTALMRAAMFGKQAIISCLIDTHRVKLEEESNVSINM